jgi:hypothetical protein
MLHCKVVFDHFSKKEQGGVLMDVCDCIGVTKDEKEFQKVISLSLSLSLYLGM